MTERTKMKIKKHFTSEKIVLYIVSFLFLLYSITLVAPFIWVFLSSLKDNNEWFSDMISLPKKWLFSNYIKAFTELEVNGNNLLVMFFNSIWLTVVGTICSVYVSAFGAYTVAKYKFKLRNLIYSIVVFIQVIPVIGSVASTYKFVYNLGIVNNPSLIWIMFLGGFGFNFFLLYGSFKSISWSYAEAAFVDGANNFLVFFKIMLPQARGTMTALIITTAIGIWNDYNFNILYLDQYPTVALGLYQFQSVQTYRSNMPILFAGVVMAAVPVLIFYGVFNKTIMKNTVAGGLKG